MINPIEYYITVQFQLLIYFFVHYTGHDKIKIDDGA